MPVVNNVDAALTDEPSRIVDVLARQARSPVRWVEVVRRIAAEGVIDVIECGPGKVLSGFTKRIEPTLQSYSASDRDSLLRTLEALR
jgi:[acyl-carrier-protein] S-malonyltransferase